LDSGQPEIKGDLSMRLSRNWSGADTVVRAIQVYNASSISNGALLMLGTTDPDAGADMGIAHVIATTGSSAEAVNSIGIVQGTTDKYGSTVTVSGLPNSSNPPYLNAIVNPDAHYYADYDQTTVFAATTVATALTAAGLEDDIDNSWVYFVSAATVGNPFNLRQLTASALGSATMDSSLSGGNEAAGTIIKILKPGHALTALNATATGMRSQAAAGAGVSIRIVENYIDGDGTGLVPLRNAVQRGTKYNANTKFIAEIALLSHLWRP